MYPGTMVRVTIVSIGGLNNINQNRTNKVPDALQSDLMKEGVV
jgi:hypothetical protein